MRTRTRQITAALKRKFGPLPAFAWLAILAVGIYLYRSRRSNPIAASVANTGTDTGTGTGDTGTGAQPPTVLGPGEAAYDPGTGKLYGNAPEQQPGTTGDLGDYVLRNPPQLLDPGQSIYDDGKIHTAPVPKTGRNGKTATGKTPGKGRTKAGKTKRSAAQMRKDNPGMVKRVKDRVLKSKKRHNVTTPAKPGQTTRPTTGTSKPRAGGAVKNQGTRAPGTSAKPAASPKPPKNRGLSHAAATPTKPRATATTKTPVAVKSAPMVQRPAAPVSAPKAKPAPKPAPRKRK